MVKELIYKIINLVTFGRGIKRTFNGNGVRIPTRYFRYFPKDYEKENLKIVHEHLKEGMFVIDVGAHFGLMSVIFGNKVKSSGRVYAFEPTPTTFSLLEQTIKINSLSTIVLPVKAALSEKSGETVFYISNNEADNSNSLVDNKRTDRKEEKIDVKLYSIDDFVQEKNIPVVNFIKIDAEGAELQVLKGAQKTIEKFQPKIILALHPQSIKNFGDSLPEIWNLVKKSGYRVILDSKEINAGEFNNRTDLFDVFLVNN